MTVGPLEQARRDLKGTDPDLYAYIAAVECAKAFDSAGDTVSGANDGPTAANRLWQIQANWQRRASVLREKDA